MSKFLDELYLIGTLTDDHEHEQWQLQESASGGMYCAACGAHIDEYDGAEFVTPSLTIHNIREDKP